jgi:hypothetical protein
MKAAVTHLEEERAADSMANSYRLSDVGIQYICVKQVCWRRRDEGERIMCTAFI